MKNTPLIFVIIFLFLLPACLTKEAETEIPPDILSRDKMEKIVLDMQTVEGILLYERSQGNVSDSIRDIYFNAVFEKYGISSAEYRKSLEFYKDHLELFDEIYKQVVSDLEKKNKQLN